MGLVNGYDSDSGSDSETISIKAETGLASLLPAPVSAAAAVRVSQSASSSGLKLPPPASTNGSSTLHDESNAAHHKRKPEKRQIKIDALEPVSPEEDVSPKRTKVDASRKSGLTGLMGLLPAPKERPPPAPDTKSSETSNLNNMGLSSSSTGRLQLQSDDKESKKAKGNNDFRAMLGLKPSSVVPRLKPKAEIITEDSKDNSAFAQPQEAVTSMKEDQSNFFSIPFADAERITRETKATMPISSAPVVEDEEEAVIEEVIEEDQYAGWQQGPDGNWFPVTPEAHAAYSQYLASQGSSVRQFTDRPADMQFNEADLNQSVDANASRQAWLSRPSTEIDTSASGLDRKYAMAAASLATPDQGIPLVDQEEEIKKMDKKTNFRARRKGQLSALIAQAEENREKLEEKWSRGKDGRHAAKEKYGF